MLVHNVCCQKHSKQTRGGKVGLAFPQKARVVYSGRPPHRFLVAERSGKERGSKKGRSDHARGGGTKNSNTTLKHVLRTRPVTVAGRFVFFTCPKENCRKVTEFSGKRWVYDLRSDPGEWKAVGFVCQRRNLHSVAEMVPCKDATGILYTKEEMKALPFIGNKAATVLVQKNQAGFIKWLRMENRLEEYGLETVSDVDLNDALTWWREDSVWR